MLRKTPLVPTKLAIAIGVLSTQALAPAFAQSTDDRRLEEIIVTSQKIAENLQDVPISVATVTGEKFETAGIENLEDLTAFLPNIHFTESGFSTQVRVRGIGSDNSQGFEQSVGMYMDGIYYGRAQLFRAPMMDMQRAELLRGPQSTLFGKNSIAGALNLTTAQPTEEFEGKISSSYEFEHEQTEINAVVSGPITEQLRARVAVRGYEDLGYMENTYSEKMVTEPYADETAARVTLDWTPTETLAFNLKVERNEFETRGRSIEITLDETVDHAENDQFNSTYNQWLEFLGAPGIDPNLDYRRQTDGKEFSDNEITNITLTTNIDLEDYTLTLVTGSLGFEYNEFCDCDFTAAEILNLELFEDYEQFSQEIRLASPIGEEFEWTAGLFYQDYDQTFTDDLIITPDNLLVQTGLSEIANTAVSRDFEQSSEAWALFGRVTWNVTTQLSVTLGARYTEEDKEASKLISLYNPTSGDEITDPVVGFAYLQAFLLESEAATASFTYDDEGNLVVSPLVNSGHDISGSRDESAFTPLVNIEYDINDDMMAYATFTTGFKAGGFDPRSNSVGNFATVAGNAVPETNPTRNFEFEEEKATAMEIGFKSTVADGRGEVNVALYRTEYDDLQISQFDGGVGFNVGNARETVVQGLELDGRWLLIDNLTMSYGLSYLDFEYKDFENGNCNVLQTRTSEGSTARDAARDIDGDGDFEICSYTGKRGVYTPEYTINLGLDYFTPITDTIGFASFIDMQHVDSHNVHVNLDPNGEIDAYTMLTARVGLEGPNWTVGVLGKNLLDEKVLSYSANAPLSDSRFETNSHYSFVRRPLTVALEGTYKF